MAISKDDFLQKYKEHNGDISTLARIYDKSESSIRKYKAKFGLTKSNKLVVDKQHLETLYVKERLSIVDIAKTLQISRDSVYKYIKQYELNRTSKYDIALLKDLYTNKNYNIQQLLQVLNINSRETLYKLLEDNNITNPIKDKITLLL